MIESELVKELLRNRDTLMGFVLALVRDHDLAEELFQETALALLAEAEKGTRPTAFLPWARAVARHRIADYYRRQARRPEETRTFEAMADVVARAFEENPIAAEAAHRRLKHLMECLRRLGQRARTIVDLRYRDRLALKDIAASIQWKESAVKVALAKARKALADCVEAKRRAEEAAAR
jgi:RNA polymerase sigma-70 factor (ECF subfamily)